MNRAIYLNFIAGDTKTSSLVDLQSKRGKSLINYYKSQQDWPFRESLKSRQSQQGVPLSEARSSRVWQEQSRINASHKANTGQRLPVPSFRDKLSMLSSKSDRPKTFDQNTSCFDPFSKHKQDLQQRLYARLRGNEVEMPDYCKQIESQRQNLHSKFFEDRHFQNETVTRDIQGIEDFVDELGRKHNYSSMKE